MLRVSSLSESLCLGSMSSDQVNIFNQHKYFQPINSFYLRLGVFE